MNADQERFADQRDELTAKIIGVYYDVYNELGYGFLESIYEGAMIVALEEAGLRVESQVAIEVHFRGRIIGHFKADLIVNGTVLLELKACESLVKQHEMQVLHYLRSTNLEVALLMNFGPQTRFKRFAMDNANKQPRTNRRASA